MKKMREGPGKVRLWKTSARVHGFSFMQCYFSCMYLSYFIHHIITGYTIIICKTCEIIFSQNFFHNVQFLEIRPFYEFILSSFSSISECHQAESHEGFETKENVSIHLGNKSPVCWWNFSSVEKYFTFKYSRVEKSTWAKKPLSWVFRPA